MTPDDLRKIAQQVLRAADQLEEKNYIDAYANTVWAKEKLEKAEPILLRLA